MVSSIERSIRSASRQSPRIDADSSLLLLCVVLVVDDDDKDDAFLSASN